MYSSSYAPEFKWSGLQLGVVPPRALCVPSGPVILPWNIHETINICSHWCICQWLNGLRLHRGRKPPDPPLRGPLDILYHLNSLRPHCAMEYFTLELLLTLASTTTTGWHYASDTPMYSNIVFVAAV